MYLWFKNSIHIFERLRIKIVKEGRFKMYSLENSKDKTSGGGGTEKKNKT